MVSFAETVHYPPSNSVETLWEGDPLQPAWTGGALQLLMHIQGCKCFIKGDILCFFVYFPFFPSLVEVLVHVKDTES